MRIRQLIRLPEYRRRSRKMLAVALPRNTPDRGRLTQRPAAALRGLANTCPPVGARLRDLFKPGLR